MEGNEFLKTVEQLVTINHIEKINIDVHIVENG